MSRDDNDTTYHVVMNDEEQYSIWPTHKPIPPGWRNAECTGPKSECLAFIERVWTDMRPLSLRRKMDESAHISHRNPTAPIPAENT